MAGLKTGDLVMRSLASLLALAVLATAALAGPEPAAVPSDPLVFGAPITTKKPVKVADLAKKPEKFKGKTVRLEGVVKEVCQGRGCWVEVAAPGGASFMARSLDHSILLPKDCQGRSIVVEGVVTTMPAEAHEEHGAEMPAGHTCPKPAYVVATRGIELRASR
jgi:hypothetical protein